MADKLGPYVSKLMTVVIDNEEEEFVKQLAWNELQRINSDVEEFLRKNSFEKDDDKEEETIKQLLQEKKDVSK